MKVELNKIDEPYYTEISASDQAKKLGMKSFDTSLPQSFFDYVEKKLGVNPYGHVVWCYDAPNEIWGAPVGITREGALICKIYFHVIGR